MRNLEKDQRKIIKKIIYKIDYVEDQINHETNSEIIFFNRMIFLRVMEKIKEIKQLRDKILIQIEVVDSVNRSLTNIADIIDKNIKYYDDESK
ncbi:MAG TPA: hypothetical protein VIO43_02160 [Lutibacter sp.]